MIRYVDFAVNSNPPELIIDKNLPQFGELSQILVGLKMRLIYEYINLILNVHSQVPVPST
jgi:hypothetical protein